MAEVELTEDALLVHVRGLDRIFALRSRLEIPLSHVVGAEVGAEVAPQLVEEPQVHGNSDTVGRHGGHLLPGGRAIVLGRA